MRRYGYHGGARMSWVGLLLVVVGVWWLLDTLGFGVHFEWKIVGPIALIAFGLSRVVGRRWCCGVREEGPFVQPPQPPQ